MKHKEKQTDYFECVCGCSIIRLTKWDNDTDISLSIFGYKRAQHGWQTKLKHIWKIIRTGTPYDDDIILESQEAKNLSKALTQISKS